MKYVRLLSTLLLLTAISAYSLARPALVDYGRLPTISNMAISPNGELVAYRRTNAKRDVVIVSSIKTGEIIRGLNVEAIDPQKLYFFNDDSLILKVSSFKKMRGYVSAMDISTAYSYHFRDGQVERLINLGGKVSDKSFIYPGQTGMGEVLGRSPDKKYVFMPAFVADSYEDEAPNFAMLKVRADGKRSPRLFHRGTDEAINFFMNDAGKVIARESFNDRLNVHTLEAKLGRKWQTIFKEETDLRTHSFVGLTSDFSKIVFLIIEKDRDFTTYYTMALKDGAVEKLPYARTDANIDDVITDINQVVLGVRYSGLTPSYKFFDAAVQSKMDAILKRFPKHSVYLMDWSEGWKDIVVKVEGSNFAGDFYLFSDAKDPKYIASAYPALKPADIHPLGTITYKARDGRDIPTIVTIPRDKLSNRKNLPAVVLPHGGPAQYDRMNFNFLAQALASRGYLVIQPQFRGSDGFGWEHESAGYGEWGRKMQDDLTDAVTFFTKKGIIDPKRVCIAGASYGGYAALAGAAFTPDLYQCAFSLAGISHLPKMLHAEKRRYGDESRVIAYLKMAVGGGELEKKQLEAISPYYHANNVNIPVMLVHGEDDTTVDFEQSKLMYKALKKAGANVALVKLKHEDHYLKDGDTRLQALKALVSFVDKHIGAVTSVQASN